MAGMFWRTLSHSIDATKQRLKSSSLVTRVPFIRYSYLFEYPKTIVIAELKMGFVPTPKVANRSMKIAIASHIGMQYRGDIHHAPWHFTPLALLRDNDYYRFGFVRNPLDRLLSCYAQKIVYYEKQLGMKPLLWRYGKTFHKDMSFAEFVEAVAKIPDRVSDIHFRSQHTFLYHRKKLMVDFVGHFEQLEQDWGLLREKFGLPALPHQNRSQHVDYREAYTPELARLAARRYRKDIELFGYSEEIAELLE
jgi:chondroitin 4-sulfotransferase 11